MCVDGDGGGANHFRRRSALDGTAGRTAVMWLIDTVANSSRNGNDQNGSMKKYVQQDTVAPVIDGPVCAQCERRRGATMTTRKNKVQRRRRADERGEGKSNK